MEKYENMGMIGEGSYGMVMKCRHKDTRQLVAIKKFIETEDDKTVKKIALREVRMLKQVRHENLINLIEVFRRKKRLYLVFEFMDHTALDDLERYPTGADEMSVKNIMFQVIRGVEFCHGHNILHRDVKPENILISKRGIVKLCDFGFARTIAPPGEVYTDYVATRWYRAPELLVGDTSYGKAVDVWAIGCLFSEMLTGEPLFPGDSDIDQIYLVTKCFGNMIAKHREIFSRNPLFLGMRLPEAREVQPLERRYPRLSPAAVDIIKWSLCQDPGDRPTCSDLLRHELFTRNGWVDHFMQELRRKVEKEIEDNPLLRNLGIPIPGAQGGQDGRARKGKVESHSQAPPTQNGSQMAMPPSKKVAGPSDVGGMTSGTDPMTSDGEIVKKKKKKVKKEHHGGHKEKLQVAVAPEKGKYSKHLSPIQHSSSMGVPVGVANPSLLDPVMSSSKISLTGSRTHLAPLSPRPMLSPRHPLSPRQPLSPRHPLTPRQALSPRPMLSSSRPILSPRNGHTNNGQSNDLISGSLKPSTNVGLMPSPSSNSKHIPQVTFTHLAPPTHAPPPLHTNASFTGQYASQKSDHALLRGGGMDVAGNVGYGGNPLRTTLPSDTDMSLISERSTRLRAPQLSPLYRGPAHNTSSSSIVAPQPYFLSPHGSPRSSARLKPGGGGALPMKKQFSKSKDVVLPQLRDTDSQLMKMSSQKVGGAGSAALGLASNSQSNGFGIAGLGMGGVGSVGAVGNRGRVLGPMSPHMNSLDSYRTNPAGLLSPPSPTSHAHHNVR